MTNDKNNNRGPIELLKKIIFSRKKSGRTKVHRTRLSKKSYNVQKDWEHGSDILGRGLAKKHPKKRSFPKQFLIFSIAFFVIAATISAVVIIRGSNVISSRNVDIAISGSSAIAGGEPLVLEIEITNYNKTELALVDLLVEYPEGARDAKDLTTELVRFRESLGNIEPGGRTSRLVEAVIFGEAGSRKEVKVIIEYRVKGSNAIFFKERVYEFDITSAPLNLSIDMPKEVNAGQELELTVELSSNSRTVVKDVLLKIEYPFGFIFDHATTRPTFDENTWSLGDIEPQGKRTISIIGVVEAQDEEERTFRFSTGIQSNRDEKQIGTPFLDTMKSIVVRRPFIGLNVVINSEVGEKHIAASGQSIRTDITWRNNLPVQLADIEVKAHFRGESLDERSVSAKGGFYRSLDNTTVWNKREDPTLSFVDPGESRRSIMSFKSFDLSSRADFYNPRIIIDMSVSGWRVSEDGVSTRVSADISREIKIKSDLLLASRIVHFAGPFKNSGPIPPQAEKETTYTIIWSVINSSNDVSRATVRAVLPTYVRWLEVSRPSTENITYNPIGGEVFWDLGDLNSGTGHITPTREVAFQIGITPSVTQIDSAPVVIGEAILVGNDQFTQTSVGDTRLELTTSFSTDPGFQSADDKVVE